MARTKAKRKGEQEDDIEEGEEPLFQIDTAPAKVRKHNVYQPAALDTPDNDTNAPPSEAAEESAEESASQQKLDKGKSRAIEIEPTQEELQALRDLQADEVDGADVRLHWKYYLSFGLRSGDWCSDITLNLAKSIKRTSARFAMSMGIAYVTVRTSRLVRGLCCNRLLTLT